MIFYLQESVFMIIFIENRIVMYPELRSGKKSHYQHKKHKRGEFMKIGSTFGKLAAALGVGLIAISAQAGFWDWTRPFKGPGRQVSTLVITGNYKRPLALAQLIRAENRQPYLLVPAQESGLNDVYFCPVNDGTPATRLRPEDITRFVLLLNPEKVIILGDVRYVPQRFVPNVEKRIPVVRIDCDDWKRVARTLGPMLSLNYLERDYDRIGEKLNRNELYRPLPAPPKTAVKPEVKKEEPSPAAPAVVKPAEIPAAAAETEPAAGEVTPVGEIKPAN